MLFPAEEGLATPPMHLSCQGFFCNKALNKMLLVSSVDSCPSNLSQLPLVAPPALRQRSDPHVVLLTERSFGQNRHTFLFQRHTGMHRADRGRHTVQQAYGSLI